MRSKEFHWFKFRHKEENRRRNKSVCLPSALPLTECRLKLEDKKSNKKLCEQVNITIRHLISRKLKLLNSI